MGVSQRVIEWLRAAGHDAVHLRDEGLQRMPNGDIFQKGFVEQRIVLTFDLAPDEVPAWTSPVGSAVSLSPRPARKKCIAATGRGKYEDEDGRSVHAEDGSWRVPIRGMSGGISAGSSARGAPSA